MNNFKEGDRVKVIDISDKSLLNMKGAVAKKGGTTPEDVEIVILDNGKWINVGSHQIVKIDE